jgi:hypothetical protein
MTLDHGLSELKEKFCNRYNKNKSIEKALRSGTTAASQHNSLYVKGITYDDKRHIKEAWWTLIEEVSSKYADAVDDIQYENDILYICRTMNEQFASYFYSEKHQKYNYDPGFRVSHA